MGERACAYRAGACWVTSTLHKRSRLQRQLASCTLQLHYLDCWDASNPKPYTPNPNPPSPGNGSGGSRAGEELLRQRGFLARHSHQRHRLGARHSASCEAGQRLTGLPPACRLPSDLGQVDQQQLAAPSSMARKFAILVAGEPDQAVIDRKGTFEQMFLDLLRDEGRQEEEWQLFFAFQGQLPSEQELDALSGVVITGSVADAFGDEDWLRDLRRTVRAAMDQRKQVLGVCFGHQLVGVELGARVGRAGCWEVGAREVAAASGARRALQERGAGWAGLLPDRLCLHEFHQDQVLEVPQGATLLASSERCPVEMFAVGSHVLCIQGHPEFDGEVVRLLAQPRLEKMGAADVARMEESMAKLAVGEQAAQLQRLCRAFLKGG